MQVCRVEVCRFAGLMENEVKTNAQGVGIGLSLKAYAFPVRHLLSNGSKGPGLVCVKCLYNSNNSRAGKKKAVHVNKPFE